MNAFYCSFRSKCVSAGILIIVGMPGTPCLTFAKNLHDYKHERNAADYESFQAQSSANLARKRANQNRAARDQAQDQKNQFVKHSKGRLQESGERKVQEVTDELAALRENAAKVRQINHNYLNKQRKHSNEYRILLNQFREFVATEEQSKLSLQVFKRNIQSASDEMELASPREGLLQLKKTENSAESHFKVDVNRLASKIRNLYSIYETRIDPFQEFLVRYNIPKIDSPRPYLDRIDEILTYIQQRKTYFSSQTESLIVQIEARMGHYLTDKTQAAMIEIADRKILSSINTAFIQTATDLNKKYDELESKPEYQSNLGCRRKLKPYADFFIEVLAYEQQCGDLDTLRANSSPYYTGCKVLEPLLRTANSFFERMALREINEGTLRKAKRSTSRAPIELAQKLSKLSNQAKESGQTRRHLLEVIRVHDELLNIWEERLLQENSSSEEGAGEL